MCDCTLFTTALSRLQTKNMTNACVRVSDLLPEGCGMQKQGVRAELQLTRPDHAGLPQQAVVK